MQLIHFKEDTGCTYPVGASFNKNRDYIVEVARTIHTSRKREVCCINMQRYFWYYISWSCWAYLKEETA